MVPVKTLSIAAIGATFAALGTIGSAQAAIFRFDTSDNQFTLGIANQGWWSPTEPNNDFNDNYFVGRARDSIVSNAILRNFFTFDLSSLNEEVVSATLRLQRYEGNQRAFNGGNPTQTLGFFDVSTPAATLNNNEGTSAAIFDDLGTGKSYGTFDVSTRGNPSGILSFTLNSAAIADINAAAGGLFSIGGALDAESLSSPGEDQFLFAFSGRGGVQQLVINVPEPSSVLGTLAFSAFGAGWVLRRRQKNHKIASGAKSITEASE